VPNVKVLANIGLVASQVDGEVVEFMLDLHCQRPFAAHDRVVERVHAVLCGRMQTALQQNPQRPV
jgi:hypothetical protein